MSDGIFEGLDSLQVLTLAHNRIKTLSSMSLHPLHNLHALVLSHNLIGSDEYEGQSDFGGFDRVNNQLINALKGKNKLRSISLDHNLIKHLSR